MAAQQIAKSKVTVPSDGLRHVPLKNFYPRPVSCIDDNNEEVIIFVSHTNDSKIFCYKPSTDKYKILADYPKAKMKYHTIACNTLTKQLYIYDGLLPTFFILSISKTSTKRTEDLRVSSKKLIKTHNVIKTGKGLSSLYIGEEYDEYYIIGGTYNNKQYVWNDNTKRFELYSVFNGQQQKNLQQCTFLFIKSKNCFIIFGGNLGDNMYALNYDQSKTVKNRNWFKIGSPFPLGGWPWGGGQNRFGTTIDYGYCLYKDKFIIVFGGLTTGARGQMSFFVGHKPGDRDDIYVCSIENGFKWYEPLCRLPQTGRCNGLYLAQNDKIHVFKKFDSKSTAHWRIDPKSIFEACGDEKININAVIVVNEQKEDTSQSQSQEPVNNNINNNCDISIQLNAMMKTINDLKSEVAVLKSKVMVLESRSGINKGFNDKDKLQTWLAKINMTQYYMLFVEQGFSDDISSLTTLNENDLISIGISKMAHRKTLLTEIQKNISNNTNDTEGYT